MKVNTWLVPVPSDAVAGDNVGAGIGLTDTIALPESGAEEQAVVDMLSRLTVVVTVIPVSVTVLLPVASRVMVCVDPPFTL